MRINQLLVATGKKTKAIAAPARRAVVACRNWKSRWDVKRNEKKAKKAIAKELAKLEKRRLRDKYGFAVKAAVKSFKRILEKRKNKNNRKKADDTLESLYAQEGIRPSFDLETENQESLHLGSQSDSSRYKSEIPLHESQNRTEPGQDEAFTSLSGLIEHTDTKENQSSVLSRMEGGSDSKVTPRPKPNIDSIQSKSAANVQGINQPNSSARPFDHILQKNTPVDQMVFFFQYYPLAVNYQPLAFYDILQTTPVRGFDFFQPNAQLQFSQPVINQTLENLNQVLPPINSWLNNPANSHEAVFLNFQNQHHFYAEQLNSIFGQKLVMPPMLSGMYQHLGYMPTINQLTVDGPKVVVMDSSNYQPMGYSETWFCDYGMRPGIKHIWENGGFNKGEPLTVTPEVVDNLVRNKQARIISLDKASPKDPRFYKPEARQHIAGNQNIKLDQKKKTKRKDSKPRRAFQETDAIRSAAPPFSDKVGDDSFLPNIVSPNRESSQSMLEQQRSILGVSTGNKGFVSGLVGVSAGAAAGNAGLGLAQGVYGAVQNERQIRQPERKAIENLKKIELLDVLSQRKKNKKQLNSPITIEDIAEVYIKQQKSEITRNTLMPGMSSTVTISAALMSLGALFPPAFLPLAIAAGVTGGIGAISTIAAAAGNRKRLQVAIEKLVKTESVKKQLMIMVKQLELERGKLLSKINPDESDNSEHRLLEVINKREAVKKLQKTSRVVQGGTIAARATGMSKYGLPALGAAAMGLGAAITGVLVGLSAAMNFKDRRRKLDNVTATMTEAIRPDLDKKKYWLFGSTAFERYLDKYWERFQGMYPALKKTSKKEALKLWQQKQPDPDLPDYLQDKQSQMLEALRECRQACTYSHWEEKIADFTNQLKPPQVFAEVRKDPKKLRNVLKEYAIKMVGDFAHNDTFSSGKVNTLRLTAVTGFAGILFPPMFGIAAGIAATGLGVSKLVAVKERKLFEKKLRSAIEHKGITTVEKDTHSNLNTLLDTWTNMLST